jgi:hypothetical protein
LAPRRVSAAYVVANVDVAVAKKGASINAPFFSRSLR